MAVFRDLLRLKLPRLSQHLHHLQKAANREAGGIKLCVCLTKELPNAVCSCLCEYVSLIWVCACTNNHLISQMTCLFSGSYEPPLTNVFTMQWFLTMFATCLPAPTVLKIWDSVFFEGSEVLFRVALAIWERLGESVDPYLQK